MKKSPLIKTKIDFHDAHIKELKTDYMKQSVSIAVDYYVSEKAAKRKKGLILFEGVESFSENSNLKELKLHEFAGTVSYLRTSGNSTSIYLAAGCITIIAENSYFIGK